jgi:D-sedoheptulose 7-phosphate isomerase
MTFFSQQYLQELCVILDSFPHENFSLMVDEFISAYQDGRRIFVMGNGGSGGTATHWTGDINKGSCSHLDKRFKMICLSDNIPTMMAYANDLSYEDIFVQPLRNFYCDGDLVIGISGSGNSVNVLKAIEYANDNGGKTVGICGYDGGKLIHTVDIPVLADVNDMQKVEDVHMIIAHMSMQAIMQRL